MLLTNCQWRAREVCVDFMRWLVGSGDDFQEMYFGKNYRAWVARLQWFIFRHDLQAARRSELPMLPAPKSVVVALLPAPRSEDEAFADVAPPWELLVAMQVQYGQYDVDALSPDDSWEFAEDLEWCRFWLDWYSRNAC